MLLSVCHTDPLAPALLAIELEIRTSNVPDLHTFSRSVILLSRQVLLEIFMKKIG